MVELEQQSNRSDTFVVPAVVHDVIFSTFIAGLFKDITY